MRVWGVNVKLRMCVEWASFKCGVCVCVCCVCGKLNPQLLCHSGNFALEFVL